jgi:hypothetical protein
MQICVTHISEHNSNMILHAKIEMLKQFVSWSSGEWAHKNVPVSSIRTRFAIKFSYFEPSPWEHIWDIFVG